MIQERIIQFWGLQYHCVNIARSNKKIMQNYKDEFVVRQINNIPKE